MSGDYRVALVWGSATLKLRPDGTFEEVVQPAGDSEHKVQGKWSVTSDWQSSLSLQPFWQFTQNDQGMKVDSAALPVESWWLHDVRIEFGDVDSAIKMRKQ